MCVDKDIQEMLPAYLEQGLDAPEQSRVKDHLDSCEDCRAELSLLRMMTEEAVPDPGEAFWISMPGRVRQAVREERSKKKLLELAWFTDLLTPRRWALATIGLALVLTWFITRPAPVDIARTMVLENEAWLDDRDPAEPLNMAELSSTELDAATQWAQNELAPIHDEISAELSSNSERNISEELSDLSPRELDRLYEMLNKKEQDAREKQQDTTGKKKDLG